MKKYLLLIMVVIVLAGCSNNSTRYFNKIKYPELNNVTIPDVKVTELSNGIKVYLMQDNKLPQLEIEVEINGGSITDDVEKLGLAEFANYLITSGGTATYSPQELDEVLTNNAIRVGGNAGLRTSNLSINFLKEDKELGLELLKELVRAPRFDEEKFNTLKTQLASNIYRRNDDPSEIAFREYFKAIFGADYPSARHSELYTLNSITLDDVKNFHNKYFYPQNLTISVYGDFEEEDIIKQLEHQFNTWSDPREGLRFEIQDKTFELKNRVHVINQEDAQQSWVLIGHATNLLYEDDDYPAMVLLNEILGGSFNSRIFRTVRTEMGLSYSPSGTLQAGFNSPGLLYLLAPTASENTVLAADALVNELRKIRDEKVTKEELQFAKNIYFNSFVFNYDSKRKILSNVKLYDFFGYDRNFPNQLKAKIEKVTINDIQRVAQKYLHPDQLTYLFVGNEAEFTESVSKFGEVTHVDISIKESLEETVLDMEKGNNIFKSMMDDIKGKKLINSVVNTSINTFYTPQGEMSMDKLTSVAFPNQISDEVSSPMGKITLKINGDKGIQAMEGRGSMPLPAEAISSTLSELMNSYFGWLYHDNNLSVGFIRDDSANGTAYSVIQIETSGKIKEVWVDKTTNLPGFIIEKVDTGTETLKIKTSFSDYARYEGVYCPKTISSKLIDGTPVSSITFTSIKFNVKIDDSIFTF